jgi:hypothetical protein
MIYIPYPVPLYQQEGVHTDLQLGSVAFLPAPKIKCSEKYLFSRHPKHTIGNCSLRSVQIQCKQNNEQFLQKLKNPKSSKRKMFFVCTHERTAVS